MATLIAMAIVWEFMLHPQFGLVNGLLRAVGLQGHSWLQDRGTALYALCVIGIWQALGFNMVLFLAGLVSIPKQLYDAAEIDGADSAWSRFRLVTWPMLGPVTAVRGRRSPAIRSFQVFDTVQVLTKGGPSKSSEVLIYTMYTEGFEFFRSGYGAAVTVVFLAFVLLLTLLKSALGEPRSALRMTPRGRTHRLVRDPALPAAGRRAGHADAVHLDDVDRVEAADRDLLLRPASASRTTSRCGTIFATAFAKANLWRFLLNGVIVTVSIFAPAGAGRPAGRLCAGQAALRRPRRAVRAGAVLHPDPAAGDRDPGVPAAAQARHARQLCGAGRCRSRSRCSASS